MAIISIQATFANMWPVQNSVTFLTLLYFIIVSEYSSYHSHSSTVLYQSNRPVVYTYGSVSIYVCV